MNPYIQSLRLRTLPLSMSGIILGAGMAAHDVQAAMHNTDSRFWIIFVLAICTTLSLQILSNLSNELGDAEKGTDAEQHGRAAYGLQSGKITKRQMKGMIRLFSGLCVLFGISLIYSAFWWQADLYELFNGERLIPTIIFLVLGLLAIIGAITYTLGKHSYGYIGLGDLGVFLFFGLLSTMGAYYLEAQTMSWEIFWLGVAIGLPCIGVLNLNNIRDMENDRKHGKRTFAGFLGQTGARVYQTFLIVGSLVLFALYGHWWTLCIIPVWAWHLWYIWTKTERLDKQMPVLMFTTLIVAVLALI